MKTDVDTLIDTLGDGDLTAEQLDALLDAPEGDTDETSETGGVPDASTETVSDEANQPKGQQEAGEQAKAATDEAELNAENAVILAKDKVHHIPFERLTEARERAANAERIAQEEREQRLAIEQRLNELQQQAQARADAGVAPTAQDNQLAYAQQALADGVNPEIFGDFSEEAIAKGVYTLVQAQVSAAVEPLKQALEPIKAQHSQQQHDAHTAAIYAAHPDADSIFESAEFAAWRSSQPSFIQGQIAEVFQAGSAGEVNEVFSLFKQQTQSAQSATGANASLKAAAQAAINQSAPKAPTSLSDIPSGRTAASSGVDALMDLEGVELLESLENATPEQLDRFLSRI